MNPLINKNITGIFIYCKDLRTATQWYNGKLGFSLGDVNYNKFADLHVEGEYVIQLVKSDNFTPLSKPAFSFDTEDLDLAYDSLRNSSVEVYDIERQYDHSSFCFRDCDGNMLMISYYPSLD